MCGWGVEGKSWTKVMVSLLNEGEMFTKQTLNPTIRLMKETNSVGNENVNFNFKKQPEVQ